MFGTFVKSIHNKMHCHVFMWKTKQMATLKYYFTNYQIMIIHTVRKTEIKLSCCGKNYVCVWKT